MAALSLALAFALALTQAAQVVFTADADSPLQFTAVLFRSLPAWLLLGALAPFAAAVCRRWPLELRLPAIARHAAFGVLFALVHAVLLAAFRTVQRWPDQTFSEAVRSAIFYNLAADVVIYWVIAAIVQVVEGSRLLRQREAHALALGASLAEARLDALRSQLQPHFLYNVLNTAAMLAREERGAETVAVLARLGDLLRYVLRDAPGEVTLGDELDFLRRYLELEQMRFSDRLRVDIACEPDLTPLPVPALLLQPLVENAVRHGIARRPGAGSISIHVRRRAAPECPDRADRVEIEVRDDGAGVPDKREDGIGLRNTRDRLAQRYGDAASFSLTALPDGGTAAVITLLLPDELSVVPAPAVAARDDNEAAS